MIPFGEWLPDLPELNNPGATIATNAIPLVSSYTQWRQLNAFSTALDGRPRGGISAKNSSAVVVTYCGTNDKLYRLIDAAMTDASKAGGYHLTGDEVWEFAVWGNQVIAVAITDPVQAIAIGGTSFADLLTSTRKPKARHIAAVRDFVVLGNVTDSVDGDMPNRVWWSAINNSANFDPADATQCDFQDLQGPGQEVQKVIGGEYGVILQRRAIQRMTYEGPPTIFRFDQVETLRGAVCPGGVAALGNLVFYLSDDGFYAFDGSASQPIGQGKVDRSFWNDVDPANLNRISCVIDPINSLVAWAYPGPGNNGGRPNKMLLFNWKAARWSRCEGEVEAVFQPATSTYSLDGLDAVKGPNIDADPGFLVDDPQFQGGTLSLGGFDAGNKFGYFNCVPATAILETGEAEIADGRRAFISGVRPVVNGADPLQMTVQAGTRNLQTDNVTWSSAAGINPITGKADMRIAAQFLRGRVIIPGGFTHASGVAPDIKPEGLR